MMKNRWYDKHAKLANHLEVLKVMPKRQLNELLKDLIAFARLLHPTLFEDHLFDYPLDLKRRRWYDDDPYLWLVVNGLRYAEDSIIKKIVAFFDTQIEVKEPAGKKIAVKKAAVKKPAVKKPAVKKPAVKKRTAGKAPVKKASAKKASAKKAPVKKKTAGKAPVKSKTRR